MKGVLLELGSRKTRQKLMKIRLVIRESSYCYGSSCMRDFDSLFSFLIVRWTVSVKL